MRKILLLLIVILTGSPLFSQRNYSKDYQEIVDYFNEGQYYQAIRKIDIFIANYKYNADMYYNRGLAEYLLNDYESAKRDFLQAQKSGFSEKKEFIRWIVDTPYRVKQLAKTYMGDDTLKAENGYRPVYGLKDSLQGALRPERTCFDIYFYDLTIKILPSSKSIEGSNLIYFKTIRNTTKVQIDLAENLKVNTIEWNGKKLKFKRKYNAIFIDFGEMLPAGQNQILSIKYRGKPREAPTPPWNGGFVWKKNQGNWWIGVACEHLGGSSWWPCKDHLTEKPDSMRINVLVPEGYQAVSNGNLRSVKKVKGNYSNFEWFVSYPINSYCVTLYAGKFVNFNESYRNTSGPCKIDYYVMQQNLDTAKRYYSATREIVRVYEKLYGDYPFQKDGLAMVESPYTGMENQSAIAMGDGYGKEKRRNFDMAGYDFLLVHETAHEWWGNSVTMGDMADAWISEGFATYSEQLFAEEQLGYDKYMELVVSNMENVENIWPVVGPRDVNTNSFVGQDIYYKGAALLHNLRCEINNDSLFFSVIKGFNSTYKYKPVTTADFINYTDRATGKDFDGFFNKFLYGTDPPVLQYSFTLEKDSLVFTYKWINVDSSFSMPFGIMLNDIKSIRLEATAWEQTFTAPDISSFYIPNAKNYKKNVFVRNSFTYFWTSWKH